MIIIDRLEGEFAVCEFNSEVTNIKRIELPQNVKEGDVLIKGSDGKYYVDTAETKKRKEKIEKKFLGLFTDD